jgi:prepilin-type N-terminal cleavage/methylation domain-containing protein
MLRRQTNLPISQTSRRANVSPVGHCSPASRRSGLTLVEMMVAVVMLAIGLLGLASTSGYVVRQVGGGARQTTVAHVAQSRLERLRSLPCSTISHDSATTRGIKERWVPGATQNDILTVVDTVKYAVGGSWRTQVFTMTVQCR